jgi:class 3 adenylate cyclase
MTTARTASPVASELWQMIEQRSRPGADVAAVDRRIWARFGQRRAVMFTDLAGFSRQVERFGILHFLQVILEQRKLLFPILEARGGKLLKEEGDSLLVVWDDMPTAFAAAVEMQHATLRHNLNLPPELHVLLCLGLGYGDVLLIGDEDVWGREVNVASKLGEDTARAGDILLSGAAVAALGHVAGVELEPIAERFTPSDQNFRARYPAPG